MQNKGATNIEFVLAFILFAGFVITALSLFSPVKTTGIPDSTVNYIVNELIGNVSVGMDSYSIAITNAAAAKDKIAVKIEGVEPNKKVRVEDYSGRQLDASRSGDMVYLSRGTENFVTIEFCEDFTEKSVSEVDWNDNYYKIASSISNDVISEQRVQSLKEAYDSNYLELKKQIGVPDNVDFSFILVMKNKVNITADRDVPARAEVFSENVLKEILRKSGVSEFGEMTIRIW